LPKGAQFELVNGELIERNVTVLSSLVEGLVIFHLQRCAASTDAGEVWSATLGCRFFTNAPDNIRKPGASFVRRDRFSSKYFQDEFLTVRPDIVVEVIAPNDRALDVFAKIEEYLAAEVPLVWVVDPETHIVYVHRFDGTVSKLHATDELTGDDVFPQFRCRVADLFPKSNV
jgi:Uma2 family endonuclease